MQPSSAPRSTSAYRLALLLAASAGSAACSTAPPLRPRPDASIQADAGTATGLDATSAIDAEPSATADTGPLADAGATVDAAPFDSGAAFDTGAAGDARAPADLGPTDAGPRPDTGPPLRGWNALGAPVSPPAGTLVGVDVTVDGAGTPYLAFQTQTPSGFYLYRFTNGAWSNVTTGTFATPGNASVPSIAAGATDVFITWWAADRYAVLRYDGSTITPVAGTPLGVGGSLLPHAEVAVDATGAPWVTWNEATTMPYFNNPMSVYVRSLSGGSWLDRGGAQRGAVSPSQSALAPRLAIGADGLPVLGWQENGLFIRKWNGTTWSTFAPPGVPSGYSSSSTLSVGADASSRPVAAFHAFNAATSATDCFVQRWSGAQWIVLGERLSATGGATFCTMSDVGVSPSDVVHTVWTEDDAAGDTGVYVYRCAGASSCTPVGRGRLHGPATGTDASGAKLAMDPSGRPVVAWVEPPSVGAPAVLRVWRYEGDPDL